MRSTRSVVSRVISAGAVVVLGALGTACESDVTGPDVGVDVPQRADGAHVAAARVIEAADLGVTHPAGLAFSPRAGMLLLGTRAPGTPPGSASDLQLITLAENRAGTIRIAAGITDPVNMAFDGWANRLLIFQSESNQLIEIRARIDGSLDPQSLRQIDARSFGVHDPQGLTVDPATGRLFILDAVGPRIVRIQPHSRLGLESPIISEIDLARTGWSDLRGLAFDATDGHLHVLDHAAQVLHELTQAGRIVATRDMSPFGLRGTQGMTFGPSGDATDDPSELSLYVADGGQITELSLVQPAAVLAATTATGSLVQTIETSRFSPPSPDPAGITWVGHLGRFSITDSEVNEMSIFAGVNQFEMRLSGSLARTWSSLAFSNEPTGTTYNPGNKHLFISDDNKNKIFEINPGSDGLYGTADDVVTLFDTAVFGSDDAEGVTYDFANGVLFIADGVNSQIYRVSPGKNGVFDGTSSGGDDVVSSFDTERLGLTDPEGIAYDSDFGHLYVVGKPAGLVFHVTTTGTLLRTVDISAANPKKPAGLAYAPSSVNPSTMNLWVVDRAVDNSADPKENDGKVFEFSVPSLGGNALPTVTITAPAEGSSFTEGTSITFTGSATDPEDGNLTTSLAWTSSLDGTIGSGGSFSKSTLTVGTHTITARATDSGGQQGSDAITVTVNPAGGGGGGGGGGAGTLEVRVAASSDDAEESASGGVSLSSSDLEMVFDGSDQTVGMRFNGVAIPRGATITNAYVQFQVDEANSTATSLTIRGEATDNATTFTSSTGNISSRSKTGSAVSWAPVAWTTLGLAGPDQRTPNIAAIIQEIVNRGGWSSGNSVAIIITGTGERVAEAYNGDPAGAPLLHVEYSDGSGGSNTAPTASNVTITGTAQVGQVVTGNYTYNDVDGDAEGPSTYRWLRNGAPISGATARTYALVAADQGALIVFEVTPAAATGASPGAAVQSTAVGPVAAAPVVTVTAIAPNTMVSGASMNVSITGSGFAPGASVTFGGNSGPTPSAANVVVLNATTITATITTKSGGPPRSRLWDVRVTNPAGTTGVLVGGLTITP